MPGFHPVVLSLYLRAGWWGAARTHPALPSTGLQSRDNVRSLVTQYSCGKYAGKRTGDRRLVGGSSGGRECELSSEGWVSGNFGKEAAKCPE